MAKTINNFQAGIHDTDYESKYLQNKIDSKRLINTAGRDTESLDGIWNFSADWYDACRRENWYLEKTTDSCGREIPHDWDWNIWDKVEVPSCWNMQNEKLFYFEGSGIYTRTFTYTAKKQSERVFLRFEGAAYRTTVFLNGFCLGTHDGASTPFSVEATGILKPENRIIAVIECRRRSDRLPMENTDWFSYGGLYRSISIIRVPQVFIKDWFLRLLPDGTFSKAAIDITVEGTTEKNDGTAHLSIPELNFEKDIAIQEGKGSDIFSIHPNLWSPTNPHLYTVTISFSPNGNKSNTVDCITDKIGFREIRVNGRDIFINGKPLFLKGISVHEDHITLGKTTNENIIRSTIQHLKELNGVFLRLAHYPHDPRFARIADEEGVLLWEEIPVYWAIAFQNPDTYTDAENQLSELILRDRNRASVIIWSVGNENPDTDARLSFMTQLVNKAKNLDATRPVSAACLVNKKDLIIDDRLAEQLDIIGINEYYGWYEPDFNELPLMLKNSNPQKPVIITEFGGGALACNHGSDTEYFTEEKQKWIYEQQIKVLDSCQYIKGCTPWILYDFRSPRRLNRYQQGFNRKGLIGSDRVTKKAAFAVLSQFYKNKE